MAKGRWYQEASWVFFVILSLITLMISISVIFVEAHSGRAWRSSAAPSA